LTSPAVNVGPNDRVVVDGVPLKPRERTRLFTFHKPRGLVTTDRDPEGRPTIFSILSEDLPRLVTIGRLDINTEGLLLLTNDGGLARILELPSTGWLRRYRVRANGTIDQSALDRLRHGITIDGIDYQGIEAQLDRVQGANVWLTMGLREGKNREIKRVLEHLGLFVNRLIRISFGPFQLGNLEEGKVEEIRTRVIREQLGSELSREAGLDFDAPLLTPEERRAAGERQVAHERPERPREPEARPSAERSARRDGRREPRQDRRADLPVAEAPRPHPGRPHPGPRKHVSVLRAEERAAAAAGRKRTERVETSDRKGRVVAVERITPAAPAAKGGKQEARKGRRFAADRAAAEPGAGERAKRTAAGGGERRSRFAENRPADKGERASGERKARWGGGQRSDERRGRDRPSGPPRSGGAPKRPGGRPRGDR
jgi:23S rRNA pseudouridine2605 synthase